MSEEEKQKVKGYITEYKTDRNENISVEENTKKKE